MRVIHLWKEGSTYIIKSDLPVNELPSPSTRMMYNRVDPLAAGIIASLVSHVNQYEQDLTNHPWALLGVWGRESPAPPASAPVGVVVILQWQPLRQSKVTSVVSRHSGQHNTLQIQDVNVVRAWFFVVSTHNGQHTNVQIRDINVGSALFFLLGTLSFWHFVLFLLFSMTLIGGMFLYKIENTTEWRAPYGYSLIVS